MQQELLEAVVGVGNPHITCTFTVTNISYGEVWARWELEDGVGAIADELEARIAAALRLPSQSEWELDIWASITAF